MIAPKELLKKIDNIFIDDDIAKGIKSKEAIEFIKNKEAWQIVPNIVSIRHDKYILTIYNFKLDVYDCSKIRLFCEKRSEKDYHVFCKNHTFVELTHRTIEDAIIFDCWEDAINYIDTNLK